MTFKIYYISTICYCRVYTYPIDLLYRQWLCLGYDLNHLCCEGWQVWTSHSAGDISQVTCSVSTLGHLWAAPYCGTSLLMYIRGAPSVGLKKIYISFKNVTRFQDSSLELSVSCASVIALPWLFPEGTYNSTRSKWNSSVSYQTRIPLLGLQHHHPLSQA